MELTPRPADEQPGTHRARRPRRWLSLGVVTALAVGLAVVVTKGLTDATVYFRNADEAVAQRDELGSRRFRLQGTVTGQPTHDGDIVRFDVTYNDVTVAVRHTGDPPELFRPGIPVVLEGHWAPGEDVFDSDRMLVKHDAEYESREDYDDRIRQADEEANPSG